MKHSLKGGAWFYGHYHDCIGAQRFNRRLLTEPAQGITHPINRSRKKATGSSEQRI
jgi:hypothetical protein